MSQIRIPLDDGEIQTRGETIARLMGEVATRRQALKDSCAEERKEIRALENEAWKLSAEVRQKCRYEDAQLPLTRPDGHRVPFNKSA